METHKALFSGARGSPDNWVRASFADILTVRIVISFVKNLYKRAHNLWGLEAHKALFSGALGGRNNYARASLVDISTVRIRHFYCH